MINMIIEPLQNPNMLAIGTVTSPIIKPTHARARSRMEVPRRSGAETGGGTLPVRFSTDIRANPGAAPIRRLMCIGNTAPIREHTGEQVGKRETCFHSEIG
jgi:hypothetical protein